MLKSQMCSLVLSFSLPALPPPPPSHKGEQTDCCQHLPNFLFSLFLFPGLFCFFPHCLPRLPPPGPLTDTGQLTSLGLANSKLLLLWPARVRKLPQPLYLQDTSTPTLTATATPRKEANTREEKRVNDGLGTKGPGSGVRKMNCL